MDRGSKTATAIREAIRCASELGQDDIAERLAIIIRQLSRSDKAEAHSG